MSSGIHPIVAARCVAWLVAALSAVRVHSQPPSAAERQVFFLDMRSEAQFKPHGLAAVFWVDGDNGGAEVRLGALPTREVYRRPIKKKDGRQRSAYEFPVWTYDGHEFVLRSDASGDELLRVRIAPAVERYVLCTPLPAAPSLADGSRPVVRPGVPHIVDGFVSADELAALRAALRMDGGGAGDLAADPYWSKQNSLSASFLSFKLQEKPYVRACAWVCSCVLACCFVPRPLGVNSTTPTRQGKPTRLLARAGTTPSSWVRSPR